MTAEDQQINQQQAEIHDHSLLQKLIVENRQLRNTLAKVSTLGLSMMYHNHRQDCGNFTNEFLKSIAAITQQIEVCEVKNLYKQGYTLATSKGVIDKKSVDTTH